MIRVLLDQGLAPRAAEILRLKGWFAVHVYEAGMARADDPAIIEYARVNRMACVTLDHDFHSHLATSFADSPSVVFLRIEGLSAALQAELIQRVWEVCGEAIGLVQWNVDSVEEIAIAVALAGR